MRKYIFWGLLLIVTGVLWLLKLGDILYFSWRDFLSLWPLILVWIGIGLLPIRDGYKIGLDVLIMLLGIGFLFLPKQKKELEKEIVVYEKTSKSATYSIDGEYKTAYLELSVGAVEFRLEPGTDELVKIKGDKNEYVDYKIKMEEGEQHAEVRMRISPERPNVTTAGVYTVVLDTQPVWKMDVNLGASDNNIDLTSFKVEKLELSTGASNVNLTLGELYPLVDVDVNTGVSAITISIPKSMNCEIMAESALSGKHFEGFEKKAKGSYYSAAQNENAKGTIMLQISSGVSDVQVKRY